MASTIIHLAVAKELERRRKDIKNQYDYYLGSIAPDLAKQIGMSKDESHFIKNSYKENVPNLKLFEYKYPNYQRIPYDLGYYVHLFTDKEWYTNYIDNVTQENSLRLLDGTIIASTKEEIQQLIYSDYTNLNVKIIEAYDLDLSLFYEEFKVPETDIIELPAEKIDILINKMGIILQNSTNEKTYSLDIESIKNFINQTVDKLEKELEII